MMSGAARRLSIGPAAAAGAVVAMIGLAAVYVTGWGAVKSPIACAPRALAEPPPPLVALKPPVSVADLSVAAADGGRIGLSGLTSALTVVNFWASWCPSCRLELPALGRLAVSGAGRVAVLAVSIDVGGPDAPGRLLARLGGGSIVDGRDPALKAYHEQRDRGLAVGLPATLFVDRQGCAQALASGPVNWDDAGIRDYVARTAATATTAGQDAGSNGNAAAN